MKEKIIEFWNFVVFKTIEEKNNFRDCQKEVDKKNVEILRTMLFGVIIVFLTCFILTYVTNIFTTAGIGSLRWIFIAFSIFALILFECVSRASGKNVTALIYIVNTLAFAYTFYTSVFIAPESIGISFIVVLFMVSTLYLDYGWRIHLYMLVTTVSFVIGISFFKSPATYSAEAINSFVVLILLFVIGTIVRAARLEALVVTHTLRVYAYYDPLMGIYNRRKLFEDFSIFESSKTQKKITALGILDIDYFKTFNDTYGHQKGDQCLQDIGNCFLELEQKYGASFYRYGGEEFAVAFTDCEKDSVYECITETMKMVHALAIPHNKSIHEVVTLSIGISYITEGIQTKFESVLSIADKALYQAKEAGRNNAVFIDFSNETVSTPLESVRHR